jgi:nitrate/nitrite transport system substrate-binding protein
MRFGIIALTVLPDRHRPRRAFSKHGIRSVVARRAGRHPGFPANGDNQATHMRSGCLASTMGLLGSPRKPMVIPWLLNRNGQAITLKADWKGKVQADPTALRPLADQAKARGEPLTFAMTFPPGTHAMWMRYFLGAGGIHPDKDVSLITIPPPQMVANMKIGKMDGFCVGSHGTRAIVDKIRFTAVTTQDMWKDHPEKVCAFTAEFAAKYPRTVKAVLKALHEASVWLDDTANRPEQCEIVSRPTYINTAPEVILPRLLGNLDYGDGRTRQDDYPMIFSQRNCNYPQPKYGVWWLTQFRRWGMVSGPPDYASVVGEVFRPDLYEEAMKEIGYSHAGRTTGQTLFDPDFRPDETGLRQSFESTASRLTPWPLNSTASCFPRRRRPRRRRLAYPASPGRSCPAPPGPGRRAVTTSSSPWKSAAKWTRASSVSPGTRSSSSPRATPSP